MAMFKYKVNNEGQGILELIIALGVIVVGVFGILTLMISTIQAGREGSDRIIAINLAREGIEIIRSIRDSNWINPTATPSVPPWNDDLTGATSATPVVESPIITNSTRLDFNHAWGDLTYTQLHQDGSHYVQGLGVPGATIGFFRRLELEAICRNISNGTERFTGTNNTDPVSDCQAGEEEVGLRVISRVRWPLSDGSKEITLEERLYNWGF